MDTMLRMQEIMHELTDSGLTPRQHLLITELVATVLLASTAQPAPTYDGVDVTRQARNARYRLKRRLKASQSVLDETVEDAKERSPTPPKENNINNPPIPPTSSTKAKKGATRLPDDWEPGPALVEWAARKGMTPEFLTFETERHNNWAWGRGALRSNWDASWRNWMLKQWQERKDPNRPMPFNRGNVVQGSFRKELAPEPPRPPRTPEEQARIDAQLAKLKRMP